MPLVGRQVSVTTLVDEYPVTSFGGVRCHVDVERVHPTGVDVAELDFGADQVLLLRDEQVGSVVAAGRVLRIEMAGWALKLEPSQRPRRALRGPIFRFVYTTWMEVRDGQLL